MITPKSTPKITPSSTSRVVPAFPLPPPPILELGDAVHVLDIVVVDATAVADADTVVSIAIDPEALLLAWAVIPKDALGVRLLDATAGHSLGTSNWAHTQ